MPKVLVTGGLGFIGYNAALHWAEQGCSVVVYDDVSRGTAGRNLIELQRSRHPRIRLKRGDIRDYAALAGLFRAERGFDLVVHLAGQAAVTTSVADPRTDFEINAGGSLNVLEAVRLLSPRAFFIYASTNKVYGGTEWVRLGRKASRYYFKHPEGGVSEAAPLDFHSPYGCSKGVADQYVRDYARIYGLKTAVFRQSCIYGPWQYGEADQGWVAWFVIAALSGKTLTICGDGRQVRDILYISDLLDLYDRAWKRPDRSAGRIYNAGGGPERTISLLELMDWLRKRLGLRLRLEKAPWRPGDQKVYISDVSKAGRELGWEPHVSVGAGLELLLSWLQPRVGARV